MGQVLHDIGSAYQEGIVETGKQPELFLLLAFLLSFGFIRTSAHLIRAEVSWWPGNVEVGGTHVHHLVWGILLLLIVGYLGIALEPDTPWREVIAILFGVGAGLTLDEFALWLNLEDVYWSEQGRRSIDAVIVAGVLGGLMVLGLRVFVDLAEDVESAVRVAITGAGAVGVVLAIVNVLKGKLFLAVAAPFVPLVGLVGALRLARPDSLWARLYSGERELRSRSRFAA
jgi:hypothetical protein